jgi:hypothetical protein
MDLDTLLRRLRGMRVRYGNVDVAVITGTDNDGPDGCPFGIHTAEWCRAEGEPVRVYLDVTASE